MYDETYTERGGGIVFYFSQDLSYEPEFSSANDSVVEYLAAEISGNNAELPCVYTIHIGLIAGVNVFRVLDQVLIFYANIILYGNFNGDLRLNDSHSNELRDDSTFWVKISGLLAHTIRPAL